MKYVASIQHDEKTVNRLTAVQYNTYNAKAKNINIIISVVLVFASAFFGFNSVPGILCLLLGCWMFTSIDFPARNMAKKIIEQEKDHMPWAKYEIAEDGMWITSGSGTWMIEYGDVFSLLADTDYFYVFINAQGGYMIPKKSIQEGTADGLKDFLEQKTGKKFEKPGSKWKFMRKSAIDVVSEKIKAKQAEKEAQEEGK